MPFRMDCKDTVILLGNLIRRINHVAEAQIHLVEILVEFSVLCAGKIEHCMFL